VKEWKKDYVQPSLVQICWFTFKGLPCSISFYSWQATQPHCPQRLKVAPLTIGYLILFLSFSPFTGRRVLRALGGGTECSWNFYYMQKALFSLNGCSKYLKTLSVCLCVQRVEGGEKERGHVKHVTDCTALIKEGCACLLRERVLPLPN